MDDDWDLHAVVKGCSTAVTTTKTTTTTVNTSTHDHDDPFPSFISSNNNMPFPGDVQISSFDDFPAGLIIDEGNDPFQGLKEIYQEFCGVETPQPSTTSADATTTISIPAGAAPVFHQETLQVQPSLQMNMQRQENIQLTNSNPSLPMANSQPIRPRRRKNQQMKMVRQMTQEELSADSWAWRKYGQKPIKGSPYPRNYYRCSTSKGCAARKQVERSPNDPNIFVVSYTGEHTHPRPTHRSSLSGSTRNKFSSTKININNMMNMPQNKGTSIIMSSSAAASGSSFSPPTPLIEGAVAGQNEDVEMVEEDDGGGGVGGDEGGEDINYNAMTTPNDLMNDNEDMFKGFQDSDHSSGGGDLFPGGLLSSPPWTPTSFAASFNGGCGDE